MSPRASKPGVHLLAWQLASPPDESAAAIDGSVRDCERSEHAINSESERIFLNRITISLRRTPRLGACAPARPGKFATRSASHLYSVAISASRAEPGET